MNAPSPALVTGENHGQWVPILELAAQEVFELMLGSKLTVPSEPVAEKPLEITSMVGLAGQLCGVMTVRCSTKSAQHMASKMLGLDANSTGQEMWDAVGEICNMVAGNFKNKITGLGDTCMLSVPTVITGEDYNLQFQTDNVFRTTLLFEDEHIVLS